METKKLTEQELTEIQTLRDNFSSTYSNLGALEARIKDLKEEKIRIFQFLDELKSEEEKIYQKLKNTYGEGIVDLKTGEFKSEN